MTSVHFTDKTRIYIQLKPDAETIVALKKTASTITEGRHVPDDALHMTVIHIGELSRLIAALPEIDAQNILRAAELYVEDLKQILPRYNSNDFILTPSGIEQFGNTVAVTYKPSQKLNELHQEALRAFMNLLKRIGVEAPRTFMEHDYNLRNALHLRPHVALARGASLNNEHMLEHTGYFSLMRLVY